MISLDNEISSYEPFGRSIISSVPGHKNRLLNNNNNNDENEILPLLQNDFISAELDNTRDLFRSLNDVSISKSGSYLSVWLLSLNYY